MPLESNIGWSNHERSSCGESGIAGTSGAEGTVSGINTSGLDDGGCACNLARLRRHSALRRMPGHN